MDEDSETVIADLATTIPPSTQAKMVEKLSRSFDADEYLVGDVALATGKSMEEARDTLGSVILAGQVQADLAVKAEGVPDPEEMWEWAKENRKGALQAAVKAHMENRSTSAYRSIAREYVSALDSIRTQDVLDAARVGGIEARAVNGRVVMAIPGHGEMTYREAVKLGLIRVSKNG